MKKPLKFLALILSSLILASSAEFTEAVKPKTSHNRHLQKIQTSSNILDNVVKFKSQIPKVESGSKLQWVIHVSQKKN